MPPNTMPFTNYAELQTEVPNWLDIATAGITATDIITMAEASIKDRVRIREMFTTSQASTSTTTRDMALPTGFVEMVTLHFEEDPLWQTTQVTPDQINEYFVNSAGKPRFYATIGEELEFDRLSNEAYTVEMKYYQFSALSASNTTNVILTKYPDLYMFECIRQGSIFLEEPEKLQTATYMLEGDGGRFEGIYNRIAKAEKKSKFRGRKRTARSRGMTP